MPGATSTDGDTTSRVAALDAWGAGAGTCEARAIETFAAGLAADAGVVRASLTTPWSNAP